MKVLKLASGNPENLSIVPLPDGTRCLSFSSNWRLNIDYNDETSFNFDDDKVAGRIVFSKDGPHLTVIEVGTYNRTFPSLSVTDWKTKTISMFNTTSVSHWSIFLLGDDGDALSEAPFFTHR